MDTVSNMMTAFTCNLYYQLYYQHHLHCTECPKGTFKEGHSNDACASCPEYSFTNVTGSASCQCVEGRYRGTTESASLPCACECVYICMLCIYFEFLLNF